MASDIDIEVLHPVPVRWAPRETSAERLWHNHVRTPVTLRAVPRGTMRAVRGRVGTEHIGAYAHDGRAWRRLNVLASGEASYRVSGPATLDQAIAILGGDGPLYDSRSVHACGSPLSAGDPIMPNSGFASTAPLPDRVLSKAREDLTDAARNRIDGFFRTDVVHDGTGLYVCVTPPMVHAFVGGVQAVMAAVPGSGYGWAGAAGSVARIDAYAALVEAVSGPERAGASREAARGLAAFTGLGDPDADVACFLTQVPHYLWRSWNSLSARHAPAESARDLVPGAEAMLARIRPLAARASIGMVDPAVFPEAADTVRALAVSMAALHPDHGLRSRFDEIARFVEIIAWPRLQARNAGLAADLDDLGMLAP